MQPCLNRHDLSLAAMETQADRVKRVLVENGVDERSIRPVLRDVCGVSYQAVKDWFDGRTKTITAENLAKIAAHWDVNLGWLATGEGPMRTGDPGDGRAVNRPKDEFSIPQYNTGGHGGTGLVLRDQPGVIQLWSVNTDWLRANVPHCTSPKNLCIVTGFGDSMPDTYNPGDPVLVDTGITICDHDGVYFFRVGSEGFIKRLQRIPGLGIRVLSQNKEYETWTITPDMDFQVFGKVLKAWKGRNY